MAAEASAHHGNLVFIYFRSRQKIFERSRVDSVRVWGGKDRGFSGPRTIHYKTTPTLLDERFGKRVAFFLPIVDAAPMHNHRSREIFRETKMRYDRVGPKRNRNALHRNVKVL